MGVDFEVATHLLELRPDLDAVLRCISAHLRDFLKLGVRVRVRVVGEIVDVLRQLQQRPFVGLVGVLR